MSKLMPLNELGKLRANPDALQTNVLKLSQCEDCDEAVVCEDKIDAQAVADKALEFINSVTFEGTVYTPEAPINVEDTDAIDAFLGSVFENLEINVYCKSTWVDGVDPAGTLTICHVGEGLLTNVNFAVLGDVATVRCCDFVNVITWGTTAVDAIGPINYKAEAPFILANTPYAYTGVPATDDVTAAQLAVDFALALDSFTTTYIAVTVTVDNLAQAFTIKYTSVDRTPVSNVATFFANCGNEQAFNC